MQDDLVLGIVLDRVGDDYRVNINAAVGALSMDYLLEVYGSPVWQFPALLGTLEFQGATKRRYNLV